MTRQQHLWLAAAGVAAGVIVIVVLAFGYTHPPAFPSVYDDGPRVEGLVAHLEYGREDCVWVLDVSTGESDELYCDSWVWAEGWDDDGNLLVHAGNGHDQVWVLDPKTGDILDSIAAWDGPPPGDEGGPPRGESELRSRSADGRVTLTRGAGDDAITVIDIEAPRNYAFYSYGLTADGAYVWVGDSEDRLLVVASDGSGDAWVIAEGISDPMWR